MRLDVRDEDYIWCPARVVKVHQTRGSETFVTVRFEGWGDKYNERVAWKNNDRLAPLYSFTKCVKCLVDVLPQEKDNLWPCKVHLRMPHPVEQGEEDEEKCLYAQQFLVDEASVFVEPYKLKLLPKEARQLLDIDGGQWVDVQRLLPWETVPDELVGQAFDEKFDAAFALGKNDEETPGILSDGAFEEGTLLRVDLRVDSRDGSKKRNGAVVANKRPSQEEDNRVAKRPHSSESNSENNNDDNDKTQGDSDDDRKPPAKKKATRKKKSKVPSLEELAASAEIDRLLKQAYKSYNRHYYDYCDPKSFEPLSKLDPNDTLADAKKKLGSVTLLHLLKTKLCRECNTKLGM